MHTRTDLLIGLHIAAAIAFLFCGAFFVQIWRQRRREIEYLLAGLMTVTLAAFVSGGGVAYWFAAYSTPEALKAQSNFNVAAAIAALALAIHFALRVGESRHERRVMRGIYPASAAFELLVVSGGWWRHVSSHMGTAFGGPMLFVDLAVTPAALVWHVSAPLGLVFMTAMLARAYKSGRRDALPAAVSSVALVLAALNDSLGLGAGLFRTVSIMPVGYLLFIFGVSLTLTTRYGDVSLELERRTERLDEKTRELAASLEELKQAQRELVRREQLAMVGELAAVIAHEVRNPMAIVSNAVSGLRGGRLSDDDRQRLLAIIDEEMQRLERLVSDLLNYARPVLPQHTPVDLGELARRSLALVDGAGGVKATVSSRDGEKILADGDLLRLAFENIITNAVQAMNGEGELAVHIDNRVLGDCKAVAVRFVDDGEGMGESELEQATAPFFTTRPTGTGLGLPICERIVDAHGGLLTIDSKRGEGTTVTMLLPASPEERLPRAAPRRPQISLLP